MEKTIEDIIRSHLPLIPASRGWSKLYCEVCGDGSRTKGPRGGWIFPEPTIATYHCFNCGVDANFDPDRDIPYSKHMWRVFESFGIPTEEHKALVLKRKLANPVEKNKPVVAKNPIITYPIPDHFYKLCDADSDDLIAEKAREHIKWRGFNHMDYPFYLSTGTSKGNAKEQAIAKSLKDRLIIPAFKGGDMIYYQAMALDKSAKKKYLGLDVPRSNVVYFFDYLYENMGAPLFVTEGFFDAWHLKGISIMENKLTSQQIEILNRSPRLKVVVPDRKGDSKRLAEQALELGWAVSIPDIGSTSKDVDQAVREFGKLYVIQSVIQNIKEGRSAEAAIRLKL